MLDLDEAFVCQHSFLVYPSELVFGVHSRWSHILPVQPVLGVAYHPLLRHTSGATDINIVQNSRVTDAITVQ